MKKLGILWLVVLISLMGFGVTIIPFPFVAEQMGASDFWKTFGGSGMFSLFQLIATRSGVVVAMPTDASRF